MSVKQQLHYSMVSTFPSLEAVFNEIVASSYPSSCAPSRTKHKHMLFRTFAFTRLGTSSNRPASEPSQTTSSMWPCSSSPVGSPLSFHIAVLHTPKSSLHFLYSLLTISVLTTDAQLSTTRSSCCDKEMTAKRGYFYTLRSTSSSLNTLGIPHISSVMPTHESSSLSCGVPSCSESLCMVTSS